MTAGAGHDSGTVPVGSVLLHGHRQHSYQCVGMPNGTASVWRAREAAALHHGVSCARGKHVNFRRHEPSVAGCGTQQREARSATRRRAAGAARRAAGQAAPAEARGERAASAHRCVGGSLTILPALPAGAENATGPAWCDGPGEATRDSARAPIGLGRHACGRDRCLHGHDPARIRVQAPDTGPGPGWAGGLVANTIRE